MRLLASLLAIFGLAIAAALPGSDVAISQQSNFTGPILIAPQGPADDPAGGRDGWKYEALAACYEDFHFEGRFYYWGSNLLVTNNIDTTTCVLVGKGFVSSIKLYDIELENNRPYKCRMYEYRCDDTTWWEFDHSYEDLRDVGWNNRMGAMKCWWTR